MDIPVEIRMQVEEAYLKPGGNPQGLDPEETEILICLLRKLDRKKPLGTLIFNEIAKHSVSVAIEFVALRENAYGDPEVFIIKRGADELWPGQTHAPGTILRAGESLQKGFDRLASKEGVRAKEVTFAGVVYCGEDETRGSGLSLVFAVEAESVGEESENRRWVKVEEALADPNLHYAHKSAIIKMAVAVEGWKIDYPGILCEIDKVGEVSDFEEEFPGS